MASSTMIPFLPPIETLQFESVHVKENVLALLFEPSPTLLELFTPVLSANTFSSYQDLIGKVEHSLVQLLDSGNRGGVEDLVKLDDILGSHPRLGAPKVESAMSQLEQQAMNSASNTVNADDERQKAEEAATLTKLNEEYERTFPGLKFVTFVAGRPRSEIFEEIKQKIIRNDILRERFESIEAMCNIACDRVKKLI